MVVSSLLVSLTVGSLAVFDETERINDNTIAFGGDGVDIDLRGLTSGPMDKPIYAEDLMPGEWTDWARAVVYNTQESDNVRVFFYVEDLQGDCGMTNFELWTGYALSDYSPDERDFLLYEGPLTGISGTENRVEITGPVYEYLEPNISAVVHQRAGLDVEAGNEFIGTYCEWDEVFVAESVPVVDVD